MGSPLTSIIDAGTKLWLDSVDPDLVATNFALGASGATSNPIIIADLIRTGKFDAQLEQWLADATLTDEEVAWKITDQVVSAAQQVFAPIWSSTGGNNGYVSFELDPLLEDPDCKLSIEERTAAYINLGRRWSANQQNRMIKVPATEAGLAALEDLAAAGVTLNVTLIFTQRQYELARDAVWRGATRRDSLASFKSVYSIFISRVDVYTEKHVPELSTAAQGQVGIINTKRIWQDNQRFWADKSTPLEQEIIFASTGTKKADDPPWKYVEALAGSDIQTNPPATNAAIEASDRTFHRTVEQMPPQAVLDEVDRLVDANRLEARLMAEGVQKFADPHKSLLALLSEKRSSLTAS